MPRKQAPLSQDFSCMSGPCPTESKSPKSKKRCDKPAWQWRGRQERGWHTERGFQSIAAHFMDYDGCRISSSCVQSPYSKYARTKCIHAAEKPRGTRRPAGSPAAGVESVLKDVKRSHNEGSKSWCHILVQVLWNARTRIRESHPMSLGIQECAANRALPSLPSGAWQPVSSAEL